MRSVICDIEANGLDDVTKIWCLVAKDVDTGEVFSFYPKKKSKCHVCDGVGTIPHKETEGEEICPRCHGKLEIYEGAHEEWIDEFLEFYKTVDTWVGHNFIGYDSYWINKILGTNIKLDKITDTLVLSRLFRPVSPFKNTDIGGCDNRLGGHGLEAWGRRLGNKKIDFHEFDWFSDDQLTYCIQDVEVNYDVYKILEKESKNFTPLSIRLEHNVAYMLRQQERNGFYLDKEKAKKLRDDTQVLLDEMLMNLQKLFPPIKKVVRNWKPTYVDAPVYEEYMHTYKTGKKAGLTEPRNRAVKVPSDTSPTGFVQKRERKLSKTSERIFEDWIHVEKKDGSFDLCVMQEFNPGSSTQIAERLLSLGWEPKKFTPTGNPSTDKETLQRVLEEMGDKFEEVKFLADYNIVADRHQKAEKWLELVREDGRVHGRINPIGAGTHRCSHFDDNMANIAAVQISSKTTEEFKKETGRDPSTVEEFTEFKDYVFIKDEPEKKEVEIALTGRLGAYGWESRSCWTVPPGKVLLGCDAAGIQLRGLAHYMDDKEYTRKLLEEDIHVVNQLAAGLPTRKKAKTFIYAWLLGAGDLKIGEIVGVTEEEFEELFTYAKRHDPPYPVRGSYQNSNLFKYITSKLKREGVPVLRRTVATIIKGFRVKERFLDRTPSLKRLKTVDLPNAAKEGYVTGLDGRRLWIPSEHLAMSLYLQGFEAVVMKVAMDIYHREAAKVKLPFKQVGFVHDEFQIEVREDRAHELGGIVVNAFQTAGTLLKTRCPIDADYRIGKNWAMTH